MDDYDTTFEIEQELGSAFYAIEENMENGPAFLRSDEAHYSAECAMHAAIWGD